VRFDKKSEEGVDIRPEPRKGEDSYKWNWNTPLIISPHSHTSCIQPPTKSSAVMTVDKRGKVISEDLTANIDRNHWPVMGNTGALMRFRKYFLLLCTGLLSLSMKSPVKEDLLYAGTDDGLIQVTEDAGKS